MFCRNCGDEVLDSARFCPHCGAPTNIYSFEGLETVPKDPKVKEPSPETFMPESENNKKQGSRFMERVLVGIGCFMITFFFVSMLKYGKTEENNVSAFEGQKAETLFQTPEVSLTQIETYTYEESEAYSTSDPAALEEYALLPENAAASSMLSGGDYDVWNMLDAEFETAWVEGVEGDGCGEYVEFTFPENTVITSMYIWPGYLKSKDLFEKNGAPMSILAETEQGSIRLNFVNDEYNNYDYALSDPQFILDPELVLPDGKLRIYIENVRTGWKYQDTCISEIKFWGYRID